MNKLNVAYLIDALSVAVALEMAMDHQYSLSCIIPIASHISQSVNPELEYLHLQIVCLVNSKR